MSKISRNCQTSPGTPVKDQAELMSTISRTCVNDQVEPESPASPGPRHFVKSHHPCPILASVGMSHNRTLLGLPLG